MRYKISALMLIRNLWNGMELRVAEGIRLTSFQKRNPTCKFFGSANIDSNSILGKFNAIFDNVSIANSVIGDHTFIQKNSCVYFSKIGKFCSIARGVTVGLGQHPTSFVSTHPAFYSKTQPVAKAYSKEDIFEPFRQTNIGHDVWIGQNALILDGLDIGTGAVIAAGSVVTKDIEPYAITGGVPAEKIRFRFNAEIRKRLLATEWWNMTDKILAGKCKLFSDPAQFLESLDDLKSSGAH